MRKLPPFDALLAFEAALRHGSMTAAAAELGVTQSAISHRLRRLEAFIGKPLLRRLRPGLAPTVAGQTLAEGVADVLAGMASLRQRCRAAGGPAPLRVGVGNALAHHWLVRRLPAFSKAHPGTEIELAILNTQAEAKSPDLDLRILWVRAEEGRSSSTQRLLFREQIFPVCSPALLPRSGASLSGLPLIQKGAEDARGEAQEWHWKVWFARLGLGQPPKPALRVTDIGTAVSAALEGAGVVLARSLLVHDALKDGRLVRLLGTSWDMPSTKAHIASWPAALSGDQRLRSFVSWLAAEAEATIAEVALGNPMPKRRAANA